MSDAEFEIEEGDEISTVYGDMITFVAVLFILLFTMVKNNEQPETIFTQMNIQVGGKVIEQKKVVTGETVEVSDVQGYITNEKLSQYSVVLVDEQKIKIILNDQILFKKNSTTLMPESKVVLNSFRSIIANVKNPIIIEGHTDRNPRSKKDDPKLWTVSIKRANAVLRYLVDELKVNPRQLSVQGYGGYRPLVSNDTAKNRQKNRRVEINIIRIKKASKK